MAIWVVGAFVKISVFYYATVLGTAQWLNLSDYRPVIWPLGILMIVFGFWSMPNSMDLERFNLETFPYLCSINTNHYSAVFIGDSCYT